MKIAVARIMYPYYAIPLSYIRLVNEQRLELLVLQQILSMFQLALQIQIMHELLCNYLMHLHL